MLDALHGAGDLAIGLGVLLSSIVQFLNWLTQRRNAKNIAALELNTNSIKDALVKVTGEAEHAKGIIVGRSERDF